MSDEQTIYISPEDDLTTVRERLEKIPTRYVTLVIPSQTQLRSHVAWKLLYARARELNKEVLIVSSDPQVRSVAHAVKFKVAHSLESTQAGKSRPPSRQSRTSTSSRGTKTNLPNSRTTSTKGQTETRGKANIHTQPPPPPTPQWYEPEADNANFTEKKDETAARGLPGSRSASFDGPRQQYRTEYDFRIDTSPPIRPLDSEQIEEPDLLLEDYTQAQDIRQAASGKLKKVAIQPRKEKSQPAYEIESLPDLADDPLDYLNDERPNLSSLTEQRGKASIEGYETREHVIQDVSERPTSVIDNSIEYQDEQAEMLPPISTSPFARSWNVPEQQPDNEPEVDGPPPPRRVQGVRPRQSRTSNTPSPQQHNLEEDALPPVQLPPRTIRTSRPLPTSPAASSSTASQKPTKASTRPIQPTSTRPIQLAQPATRARPNSRVLSQPGIGAGQSRAGGTGGGGTRRTIPGRGKPVKRKWTRQRALTWIVAIAVLIMIAALAYFGPSAQVTLTLQARNYSHQVSVIASLKQQANSIPAILASKTFSKSGLEAATGTQTEDKATASGYVCFNNNSNQPIDIPSLINVSTATGVLFQVQTDTVMPQKYTCGSDDSLKIQVIALKAGESGNVPAGSVTEIPDDSLAAIAKQNNVAASTLNLTVSNEKDISGGGRQPVPAVSATDLATAKTNLHKQLQSAIDIWTKQVTGNNTTAGPISTQDELINPPAVNSIEERGNFTTTLQVQTTILSVKNNDLQQAAITQLNSLLQKDKSYANYMISTDTGDTTPVVKIDQLQTDGNASSSTFTFNATAQAIPTITKDLIQHAIPGKTVAEGRSLLQNIPDMHVQTVDIQVNPSFFPWIPYWTEHIDVRVLPARTQPAKSK